MPLQILLTERELPGLQGLQHPEEHPVRVFSVGCETRRSLVPMLRHLAPDPIAPNRWRAIARFRCILHPSSPQPSIERISAGVYEQPNHLPRVFQELDERYTDPSSCPAFHRWLRDILLLVRECHEKAGKLLTSAAVSLNVVCHPVVMEVAEDGPYILPEGNGDRDPDGQQPSAHTDACDWGVVTNCVFLRQNLLPASAESRSYLPDDTTMTGRKEILRCVLQPGQGIYHFDTDPFFRPLMLHGVTPAVVMPGEKVGWRGGIGWDFRRMD